jgi:hypothetical protein
MSPLSRGRAVADEDRPANEIALKEGCRGLDAAMIARRCGPMRAVLNAAR